MHNSLGTLFAIWGIASFAVLCGAALWMGLRRKITDDDATYGGAVEGDDQHFRN